MSKGALLVGLGLLLLWLSITGRLRAALVAIGAAKGNVDPGVVNANAATGTGPSDIGKQMYDAGVAAGKLLQFVPPGAVTNGTQPNATSSAYTVPSGDNGNLYYV